MAFTVVSNSFKDGDYLSKDFILSADFGFGCAGGNTSPHLKWSDAPAGTKSFAITCYDPDAPTGSGFWHWLVVNIPPDLSELAEGAGSAGGAMPGGALQTRTDFGAPGYGGPCPPPWSDIVGISQQAGRSSSPSRSRTERREPCSITLRRCARRFARHALRIGSRLMRS